MVTWWELQWRLQVRWLLIFIAWEVLHNPRHWACESWQHKITLWSKYPSSGFCNQSCGHETNHDFGGLTIDAGVEPLME